MRRMLILNPLSSPVIRVALSGSGPLAPFPLAVKESSGPIDLARHLNQAFIEVADQVSPAVVVIRVAHKPHFSEEEPDEDNPFWDFIPRQDRKQMEEEQRQRPRRRGGERPSRAAVFDRQGYGV